MLHTELDANIRVFKESLLLWDTHSVIPVKSLTIWDDTGLRTMADNF